MIPIDVRIISATNCNLQKLVEEKKFRLDLYYRLNTLILQTVPLRERPGDISDMLLHFFKKNRIKKIFTRTQCGLWNNMTGLEMFGNSRTWFLIFLSWKGRIFMLLIFQNI